MSMMQPDGIAFKLWEYDLKLGRDAAQGMVLGQRCHELHRRLSDTVGQTVEPGNVVHVAYEDVRLWSSQQALRVYGALLGSLCSWCYQIGSTEAVTIEMYGYAPTTIKKTAGSGVLKKDAMIANAIEHWGLPKMTDNEADALWVAETHRRRIP